MVPLILPHIKQLCYPFLIAAKVCAIPKDEVLPKISKLINVDWKHVGLQLGVKAHILDCISLDYNRTDDKALEMLLRWKHGKSQPCYCELLIALNELDLHEAIKKVEETLYK